MKTLIKLLEVKSISLTDYDAMDFEAKSEILNELNEINAKAFKELEEQGSDLTKALETMTENQKDSDKLNKELHSAIKTQGQAIAKLLKGNAKSSTEKTELVKFITREGIQEDLSSERQGMKSIKIQAAQLINAVMKAPALMTTGNIIPNVASGFNQLFGNFIDSTIYDAPKPDNFILPLVTVTTAPGTENIWYVERENEEGNAAFIGEGELKPLADGEWVQKKADIKEVAVRWKMSNRLIAHAPSVVQDFRTHVDELMEQVIDDGVASGDGVGPNLNGVTTLAAPFVVPPALANFYPVGNIFDAIMAVATYVRLNNHKGALTCVLNTVYMAQMAGLKDSQNNYIVPPFVTQDGRQVGEVRIVFSNKVAAADMLLGDLKKFKTVISENVMYFEGWENDDFSKNLSSRKLEAFLGTYLPDSDSGAIIFDQIATILTAITV